MIRWEYLRAGPHPEPDWAALGLDGWEFVAVPPGRRLLFKRPLPVADSAPDLIPMAVNETVALPGRRVAHPPGARSQ